MNEVVGSHSVTILVDLDSIEPKINHEKYEIIKDKEFTYCYVDLNRISRLEKNILPQKCEEIELQCWNLSENFIDYFEQSLQVRMG